MGVIEVNFQTTKKMNRLGSGFDLCTLTKKRIIHWVAANKEQRKTQLISLSINRCAALNHLVVTQYFYLPFFLSFFPNLTGLFLSVFHLLHFALFSAMRPWMFFPPKNVSCDFKKAAAFWRVFFFQTVCRQGLLSCDLQTRESYVPPGWGSCARLALDTKLLTQSLHAPVHHMTCPGKSVLH